MPRFQPWHAVLAMMLFGATIAHATPSAVCSEHNPAQLAAALRDTPDRRLALISPTSRLSADSPAELAVPEVFLDSKEKLPAYRIFIRREPKPGTEDGDFRLIDHQSITTTRIPDTHRLRKQGVVPASATLISFRTPVLPLVFPGAGSIEVTAIACQGDTLVHIARMTIGYSTWFPSFAIAAFVTLAVYGLVALAAGNQENRFRDPPISAWRFLDPVVLSSGPNGAGSMSRLQILFFSVLLFGILIFIELRVGLLADMSKDILLLLGISGVGAATSRGVDTQRNRLSAENLAWLINKGWFPQYGHAATNVAKWRDVVTAADGFDVYHFQMLLFSLVVGLALIQACYTDLSGFTIPESILGVLGLSQAIYVGGKLTEPTSTKDFDDALKQLRDLETAFSDAARARGFAALPSAATQNEPEYLAFAKQRDLVVTLYKNLYYLDLPAGANQEPRQR